MWRGRQEVNKGEFLLEEKVETQDKTKKKEIETQERWQSLFKNS